MAVRTDLIGRMVEEREDHGADRRDQGVVCPWRWPFTDVKEAQVVAAYVLQDHVEAGREDVTPARLVLVVKDQAGNVGEVVASRARIAAWS